MKFDFGETYAEKLERIEKWHITFAWIPHRVGSHDYRWLEYVHRRGYKCSGDFFNIEWQYREL